MITTPTVDPPLPRDFVLRLSGPDGAGLHLIIDGSWPKGEWPRRLPRQSICTRCPAAAGGL